MQEKTATNSIRQDFLLKKKNEVVNATRYTHIHNECKEKKFSFLSKGVNNIEKEI